MIAVTGANGLLGSMLLQQLALDSTPFLGVKRKSSDLSLIDQSALIDWREADLMDINSMQDAFKGAHTVIHAAALVSFKASDRESLYRINVEGTRNVVNTCLSLGIPRLIHISSVAALGRQKGASEIDENNKWVENRLNSDYAESKYLAELEVFRGQEEGLKIDIVNPSVILSRANWNRSSAQLFKYAWNAKPFYTNGSINYVDARDVIKVITALLKKEPGGERIIANGGSVLLKDLLFQIANHFNKRPPWIRVPAPLITLAAGLEYLRSRITGAEPAVTPQSARAAQEKFYYNNQKAIKELGIEFRTLQETLDWCCPHYIQGATINN